MSSNPTSQATSQPPSESSDRETFVWDELPQHVYLQASDSFLMAARNVGTRLPAEAFPMLVPSSMGLTMFLDVPGELPAHGAAAARRPGINHVCAGMIVMNMHFGHPRFCAMLEAAKVESAIKAAGAYQPFVRRTAAACRGELSVDEANDLTIDLIEHTLRLTGQSHVEANELIRAALRYNDVHGTFRIAEIAAGLKVSPRKLSAVFTQYMGFTHRQRVVIARSMLAWELVALAPELSLTEIAHEMGFADLAHMSRAFREIFNATPSQFREPGRYVFHGRPAAPGKRVSPPENPDAPLTATPRRARPGRATGARKRVAIERLSNRY
jgi:AraC-like DNA-binding protein